MTHRERIVDFIGRFPGRDDDEIAAALRIKPRQTVNQICRALALAGSIERRSNAVGKLGNFPTKIQEVRAASSTATSAPAARSRLVSEATSEWFWEGNVIDALERHLTSAGWAILSKADTLSRERGVDLHATRAGRTLLVEAKGYPSTNYRDPNRAGERKPTNPSLQAQHWYSHALLKALRMQSAFPDSTTGLAFPNLPRYRALFEETEQALDRLGVAILFVSEDGSVEAHGI